MLNKVEAFLNQHPAQDCYTVHIASWKKLLATNPDDPQTNPQTNQHKNWTSYNSNLLWHIEHYKYCLLTYLLAYLLAYLLTYSVEVIMTLNCLASNNERQSAAAKWQVFTVWSFL